VAAGNTPPQFILSTANVATIEQQALIQQLLQQNTLVIGCNSLLVTSACRSDAVPVQTINCVAASPGLRASVQPETDVYFRNVTSKLNAGCGTDEVCVTV